MSKPIRPLAFTFAEILVAAPWAASILSNDRDNDKGGMLQRNTAADERPLDLTQLESGSQ
jgi:hypothetical protein